MEVWGCVMGGDVEVCDGWRCVIGGGLDVLLFGGACSVCKSDSIV